MDGTMEGLSFDNLSRLLAAGGLRKHVLDKLAAIAGTILGSATPSVQAQPASALACDFAAVKSCAYAALTTALNTFKSCMNSCKTQTDSVLLTRNCGACLQYFYKNAIDVIRRCNEN